MKTDGKIFLRTLSYFLTNFFPFYCFVYSIFWPIFWILNEAILFYVLIINIVEYPNVHKMIKFDPYPIPTIMVTIPLMIELVWRSNNGRKYNAIEESVHNRVTLKLQTNRLFM